MPHVRAGRQDERPAHAEVREQHFAKIRVDLFVVFIYRQRDVAQAQPLQHRTFARLKRHERAAQRRDCVAESFRHAEAVARRARRGIGQPARRQNDGGGGVLPFFALDGGDMAVFDRNTERAVAHELDVQTLELALKRRCDVE